MFALALVIAPQEPTPERVWAEIQKTYASLKSLSCNYTTTQAKPKKTVYRGTVRFVREKSLKFTLQDLGEKCLAGEDWVKGGSASTWVSPASFRGYNDTLSARHPYVILSLLRGETEPGEWEKEVREGKETYIIRRKDGWSFTFDYRAHRLTGFSGPELYNEERLCITVIR